MQLVRPPIATDPRQFGRLARAAANEQRESSLGDHIRLFLMTFLAGFVFVSVFLA